MGSRDGTDTMTIARKQQIDLAHTAYYHCMSRCVRQAYLCGHDRHSGLSFEHRRGWIVERLTRLVEVFAIELLAYAVMSNHYHLVLRVNAEAARLWSDEEVAERWARLFRSPDTPPDAALLDTWRTRLSDIGWFMRCINEPIARAANREDGCVGRFWEGRYKLQALLDEAAVLRCMTYVDLNPIRAKMASTPRTSAYTSVQARLTGHARHLVPLRRAPGAALSLTLREYLALVEWSGRAVRTGKRGAIPGSAPGLLQRIDVTPAHWAVEMRHYGRWYYRAVGSFHAMQRYAEHLGQRWLRGMPPPPPASASATA